MKFLLLILSLIVLSCSSKNLTKFSNIPKEYTNKKVNLESINLVFQNIVIKNADDVLDDLGEGKPETVLKNYVIDNIFKPAFEDANIKLYFVKDKNEINVTKTSIKTMIFSNDDAVRDRYPDGGPIEGLEYKYSIIVSKLLTSKKTDYGVGVSVGAITGVGVSSSTGILIQLEYYIWDNELNKIITYKKVQSFKEQTFNLIKRDWDRAAKEISENLLKGTVVKLNSDEKNLR